MKGDELTHTHLRPCLARRAVDDNPTEDSRAAELPSPRASASEPAVTLSWGRLAGSVAAIRVTYVPPAAGLRLRVEGVLTERACLTT